MTYSDSQIGYTTVTLSDPVQHGDSLIGYTTVILSDPVSSHADSAIGYAVVTLTAPANPVAVLTSTGLRYVPKRTWDGTTLR